MLICATKAGGSIVSLLIPLLFLGVLYFLMMRPQKKQQQQYQNMLSNLQKGAHVITIGGIYGVIDSIDRDKNTVVLDCDGIYLTFKLRAIREVVDEKNEAATKTDKEVTATKADDADTKDTKAAVEETKTTDAATNDESASDSAADQNSDK